MSGSTKNKVKLLECKFDYGGLVFVVRVIRGVLSKNKNYFGGLGGQGG